MYFVLIDPTNNIYSAPIWSKGMTSFNKYITLDSDTIIEDLVLLDIELPCTNPTIGKDGVYRFAIVATMPGYPGKSPLISNIATISFKGE